MNIDRRCDQCGREMEKAHRIYKGLSYCSTCYAREFKSKICPKCGTISRLLAKDPDAICGRCEKDMPCVRCGKEKYPIGLISIYGPVCKSCARYFSEPKSCGQCGELSHHLSRVKRLGFDKPVCPKCARADHGCCQMCRRSRRLHQASDGRRLCKKCLELGYIPCASCGSLMPAGRGKQCDTCYWNSVFERRLRLNQAAFLEKRISQNYYFFGMWLKQKIGAFNAALKVGRYLAFFLELEKIEFVHPDYSKLLAHFGAEQLRRVQLPIQWLIETQGLVIDTVQKKNDSERRQINEILQRLPAETRIKKTLDDYYHYLLRRQENDKTSLRSIRLSLRPALSILELCLATDHYLPEQNDINRYLNNTPGQKAALSGFIGFLKITYDLQLTLKIENKKIKKIQRKKQLEKNIILLLEKHPKDENIEVPWLIATLSFFHGLRQCQIKNILSNGLIKEDKLGFTIYIKRESFWIPKWHK